MPVQSITIQPPADQWRSSLHAHNTSEAARRFRMQLGLPTDRPVIFSGHQAIIWHAGILAKYLAAAHIAAACNGAAAWIVVDQDPEDFGSVRVPIRQSSGRLAVEKLELVDAATAAAVRTGTPPCQMPRFSTAKPPQLDTLPFATDSARAGLHAILDAAANSQGQSAAEQVASIASQLASKLANAPHQVLTTSLAHTDAFAAIIARMAEDPTRCHQCYNDAVRHHSDAGMTPLTTDKSGSPELPLWFIDPRSGVRKRVFAADLATLRPAQLAPRALLLTALVRIYGCELFIHGAGGGASGAADGYDRVTEEWITAWLGERLAPAILATATVTLPLGGGDETTPQQAEAARQKARKARHDPALVGDTAAVERKQALVTRLNATKDKHEKSRIFDEMKLLLAEAEKANAPKLAALDAEAEALAALLADQPIASDRTWAFPLHDPADLRELSSRIREAVSGS